MMMSDQCPMKLYGGRMMGNRGACCPISGGAQSEAVVDPVCGMTVQTGNVGITSVYGGKTYYFCSAECQEEFAKNPPKYAK